MVNVTQAPLAARRAHIERDGVRLGTPIAALRDHILRTVRQTKRRDNTAAARLNNHNERDDNQQHQSTHNRDEYFHGDRSRLTKELTRAAPLTSDMQPLRYRE